MSKPAAPTRTLSQRRRATAGHGTRWLLAIALLAAPGGAGHTASIPTERENAALETLDFEKTIEQFRFRMEKEPVVFVRDGEPVDLHESTTGWETVNGAMRASGKEAKLVAGKGIAAGDFYVEAWLTIRGLDESACAFTLGESYFGFEGNHGEMFLTGSLFQASGLPVGDPEKFITDGRPFRFEAFRKGATICFAIDGREVLARNVGVEGPLRGFGFLPWRATMEIERFRACGAIDDESLNWKIEPLVREENGVRKHELLPPSARNPRNSEGDFILLKDGRLMFVYSYFYGGGGDHAAGRLCARFSTDTGRTWTEQDEVVVENEADMNVMSVSLLRLQDGRIALFYIEKNSLSDCRPVVRFSDDEARTWTDPVKIITDEMGYYVLNNDRVIQVGSGRLVVPVAQHVGPDGQWHGDGRIMCYLSDDAGRTWRRSRTAQRAKAPDGEGNVDTQEPGLVQLKDGRVMMFCRNSYGSQYIAYSEDGCDTWSDLKPSNIISPRSPATLERIPSTGDLLMVWNDHTSAPADIGHRRTPLTAAISKDEGGTWTNRRTLEDNPDGWYCYTAMYFVGDRVLLGHCAGTPRTRPGGGLGTTQITSFDVAFLYD